MRQQENIWAEDDRFSSSDTTSSYNIIRIFISGLIFFFFSQSIFSQFDSPVFENISIKDGLPENSITCILQDHLGYIWLGTQNGLVRYDGYEMQIFQPDEKDSLSISGRRITVIFEDGNNVMWIGTLNGLNRFDRVDNSFASYKSDANDPTTLNSNEIYSIYIDGNGRFWIGTSEGLNLFDRGNRSFTRYYFRKNDTLVYNSSLSYFENLCVNALTEDPVSGNMLIGTAEDGLWEFNLRNLTFSKYKSGNINYSDKKIGWIQSFYRSENGKIWMASYHTLCSLDPSEKQINYYLDFPIRGVERYDKRDMPMAGIVEDDKGLIWCGFNSGAKGLFCIDPLTSQFHRYNLDPDTSENSFGNHLFCIYIDRTDILWIGQWGLGLWKWDKKEK